MLLTVKALTLLNAHNCNVRWGWFTGYVWTVGRTGEKNSPLSNRNGYGRTEPSSLVLNNRVWATWTIFVFNRDGVWRHTHTKLPLSAPPRPPLRPEFPSSKEESRNVYFLQFPSLNEFLRSFFRVFPSVELLLLLSRLFEMITVLFKLVQYLLATSAALFKSFLLK